MYIDSRRHTITEDGQSNAMLAVEWVSMMRFPILTLPRFVRPFVAMACILSLLKPSLPPKATHTPVARLFVSVVRPYRGR